MKEETALPGGIWLSSKIRIICGLPVLMVERISRLFFMKAALNAAASFALKRQIEKLLYLVTHTSCSLFDRWQRSTVV